MVYRHIISRRRVLFLVLLDFKEGMVCDEVEVRFMRCRLLSCMGLFKFVRRLFLDSEAWHDRVGELLHGRLSYAAHIC